MRLDWLARLKAHLTTTVNRRSPRKKRLFVVEVLEDRTLLAASVADDATLAANEDVPLDGALVASDVDGDPLSFSLDAGPPATEGR